MSSRDEYISDKTRLIVAKRAQYTCEYCQIKEEDTYLSCEVDHIISLKHGGKTAIENLAFAYLPCNRYEGSDIATLNENGELIRLFNPRVDNWNDCFFMENGYIQYKTEVGKATIRLLRLNSESRVEERIELQKSGYH